MSLKNDVKQLLVEHVPFQNGNPSSFDRKGSLRLVLPGTEIRIGSEAVIAGQLHTAREVLHVDTFQPVIRIGLGQACRIAVRMARISGSLVAVVDSMYSLDKNTAIVCIPPRKAVGAVAASNTTDITSYRRRTQNSKTDYNSEVKLNRDDAK